MYLEGFNCLGQVVKIELSRAVIYGQDGSTPIALLLEYQAGKYCISKAGDPDFEYLLKQLGVDKSVLVLNGEELLCGNDGRPIRNQRRFAGPPS